MSLRPTSLKPFFSKRRRIAPTCFRWTPSGFTATNVRSFTPVQPSKNDNRNKNVKEKGKTQEPSTGQVTEKCPHKHTNQKPFHALQTCQLLLLLLLLWDSEQTSNCKLTAHFHNCLSFTVDKPKIITFFVSCLAHTSIFPNTSCTATKSVAGCEETRGGKRETKFRINNINPLSFTGALTCVCLTLNTSKFTFLLRPG